MKKQINRYKNINNINSYDKRVNHVGQKRIKYATSFLILTIIFGCLSYVSMTSATVLDGAKRADFEKEIAKEISEISELESRLSSMESRVTLEFALAKGFEESSVIKYIKTEPLTKVWNTNEMEF
jgi:hypothetical protein